MPQTILANTASKDVPDSLWPKFFNTKVSMVSVHTKLRLTCNKVTGY